MESSMQQGVTTPRRSMQSPGILLGALIGLLLTAALIAVFYLADAVVGTPFVPFDMLDWMARNLPGGVITFGIDTMVNLITTLNLGETSSAAKASEQIIAISGMLITGIVATAVFFYIRGNRRETNAGALPGIILGLVIGVPVALISTSVNFTASTPPAVNIAWILIGFLAWGLAANSVFSDLNATNKTETENSVSQMDRRSFLVRVGGATATITVIGAGLGALLRTSTSTTTTTTTTASSTTTTDPQTVAELPNADAAVQPAPGTRPELTPVADHYRIDISSRPPEIAEEDYTLPIFGEVGNQIELTLDNLRNDYEPMTQYLTLACISNRVGGDLTSTQKWTGVSMKTLLEQTEISENARYLRIFSADGFDETVDLDLIMQDERIMLTYAWDDEPLPVRNGFPLRIYIPDRYGMKQPKWITEMEVVEDYEDGYWVRRGWSKEALMVTTSVVDVVAVDEAFEQDGQTFIPVGGIAHAGDRSISKVEVRVDDGEWVEAQLRDPISDKTWVIWRYDWPLVEGSHNFEVRTVDGNGDPQIETSRGTRPDGATGIHSRRQSV